MDDRSAAAPHGPAHGRPPPQATRPVPPPPRATTDTADEGEFFAVLEAVALAALGIDATTQPTSSVDDRPRPGDNR
jgi:hypothetical protein